MIYRRNTIGNAVHVHAYADLTNVSLCGYAPLRSPNYVKANGPATCAHCVREIAKARAA